MAGSLSSLDGARLLYGPGEQQQFFGQGGLAGIGMADDSEIPASIYFSSLVLFHVNTFDVVFYAKNKPGFESPVYFFGSYYNAFFPKVNGSRGQQQVKRGEAALLKSDQI